MSIVFIVLYCLIALVLIFGPTFKDELHEEQQQKQKRSASVISIEEGRRRTAKLHRRA